MGTRTAVDPLYESRIRQYHSRQAIMKLLGVTVARVQAGIVELQMPSRPNLTQEDGDIHSGIVATVLDSACSYAALTLMPANSSVATVEYKVNILAPASGQSLIVRAAVKRAGQTFVVCTADALVNDSDLLRPVATMLSTIVRELEQSRAETG
jgi:uncharacterized protein (TIGR00369 family)